MDTTLVALLIFLERIENPALKEMAFELAKADVERAVFTLGKCDLLTDACVIEEVGNFYRRTGNDLETMELYRKLHVPRPSMNTAKVWFTDYKDALE